MGLFYTISFCVVIIGGPILVVNYSTKKNTEKTVIMCIEKPKQCKKQYDFYKMRDELKE